MKANEPNRMSTEFHNHIGEEIKHQGTHNHYFEKLFLSSSDHLPAILGKVAGAGMTSKRFQVFRFVFGCGKCEAIFRPSDVFQDWADE